MSRSWKEERTTPKTPAKNAPRPRVSDFAREYYKGKGYQVETLYVEPQTLRNNGQFDDLLYPDDTVTSSTIANCQSPLDCLRDCTCGASGD